MKPAVTLSCMGDGILVTGATGLIGSALVRTFRSAGSQVAAHSSKDGDISESALNFSGIRHVFHLAAKTFVPDSWRDPAGFYKVNFLGTVNTLEFCRREKASFTLVSSYVYGHPRSLPVAENHSVEAFNPYCHSKIMAEEVSRYFADAYQLQVTIVRPFNIYGPGQAVHFLIPTLLRQALLPASEAFVVDDSRPRRDYLFVDDLVELLIRLMNKGAVGTYNAGSGYSVSVQQLAEIINRVAGTSKAVVSRDQNRPGEVLDVVADISKAKADVGWEPKISIEEGLRRTLHSRYDVGTADE